MPQVTGKYVRPLPMVEGETANGYWCRCGFVIMVGDEYPRTLAFTLFGQDRIHMADGLIAGQTVIVDYQPESRIIDDRAFTDLKCLRVSVMARYEQPAAQVDAQAAVPPLPPASIGYAPQQAAAMPPQQAVGRPENYRPAQMPPPPQWPPMPANNQPAVDQYGRPI